MCPDKGSPGSAHGGTFSTSRPSLYLQDQCTRVAFCNTKESVNHYNQIMFIELGISGGILVGIIALLIFILKTLKRKKNQQTAEQHHNRL